MPVELLNSLERVAFRRALLGWYNANKRALPWRKSRDPYRIWISEIMLQQTRVAAVMPYYERFLRRFPDVVALARARESSVLAAWSGMGYYRRARHLHAAARQITRRGEFPRSSEALQELPGIGRYTAAAIASIAFGECCAVVDGNVERVLQRITGQALSNQVAWQAAEQFLSRRRPGDFNQAMMELGATVCTPKAPHCQACPVARFCKTQGEHRFRKAVPRVRRRLAYALCVKADLVLLARRSSDASVMAGMWELPEISVSQTRNEMPIVRLRHSIMNTDYQVLVYGPARRSFNTVERVTQPQPMWVPKARLDCLPLTGLAKKILRKTSVMHPEAAIDSATPSSKTIFLRIWIR